MKEYQWNDNGEVHAHCFSDDGVYVGFKPHREELDPSYSKMVAKWVEEKKTEKTLATAMKNMGFSLTKTL